MSYFPLLFAAVGERNFYSGVVLGTDGAFGKGHINGLIHWDGKRKVIMAMAPQRTGKSVLLFRVVEETFVKHGLPWLVIDPKKEFWVHKKKLEDRFLPALLGHPEEVVGRPVDFGDLIVVFTPVVLRDAAEYSDFFVSPFLSDFLALKDLNLLEGLLMEFCEIGGDGLIATRRMLQTTLFRMRRKSRDRQTFKEWLLECSRYNARMPPGQKKSWVLIEKLTSLVNAEKVDVVGSVPLRSIRDAMLDGKIVVLQTNLSSTPQAEYDVQMCLAMALCVQDRMFFGKGFGVFCDEIDKPCPTGSVRSLSKQMIIDIALKFGAYNIWLVGITQKPELASPILFEQADIIFGARFSYDNVQWLTDKTPCTRNIAQTLLGLRSKETPRVEWAMLKPNDVEELVLDAGNTVAMTKTDVFYPLPTRSQFHTVGVRP